MKADLHARQEDILFFFFIFFLFFSDLGGSNADMKACHNKPLIIIFGGRVDWFWCWWCNKMIVENLDPQPQPVAFLLDLRMHFNGDWRGLSLSHTHTRSQIPTLAASCPVLQHSSSSRGTPCPPVASDSWSLPSSLSHRLSLSPIIWHFPHSWSGYDINQLLTFQVKFFFCLFWGHKDFCVEEDPEVQDSKVCEKFFPQRCVRALQTGKTSAILNLNAFVQMKLGQCLIKYGPQANCNDDLMHIQKVGIIVEGKRAKDRFDIKLFHVTLTFSWR